MGESVNVIKYLLSVKYLPKYMRNKVVKIELIFIIKKSAYIPDNKKDKFKVTV